MNNNDAISVTHVDLKITITQLYSSLLMLNLGEAVVVITCADSGVVRQLAENKRHRRSITASFSPQSLFTTTATMELPFRSLERWCDSRVGVYQWR